MLRLVLRSIPLALALAAPGVLAAQGSVAYDVDKRYVHVMAGQTLHTLVRSLFPGQERYWPEIVEAFGRLNAHARDPDRLIANSRLEIPTDLRAIGRIDTLEGAARARNFLGRERALAVGDPVFLGDRVSTGGDAQAHIVAEDDAQLTLRADSSLHFVEYALRENGNNRSLLNLVRGGLRTITGRIGRATPERFALTTPFATIGVRGTDFAVRLCGRGECPVAEGLAVTAAPGLYVSVLEGEIDLSSRPASRRLERGDFFYVSHADTAPQRLYEKPRLVFNAEEIASLSEPAPAIAAEAGPAPRLAALEYPALALLALLAAAALRHRRHAGLQPTATRD